MILNRLAGIGVSKRRDHITATEIYLVLMLDSSDRSKDIIGEYLKISSSHVWLLLRARIDVNSSKPRVRPRRALTHTPLSPHETGHWVLLKYSGRPLT